MADKAYITPKILQWARESAKMTVAVAASKINVPMERLQDWESGAEVPTIRQAQALAKQYKRPFALFFLPEVPRDFQPLQDFRGNDSKALTTSSIFMIREIQEKQAWISESYAENGAQKLPFIGKFTIQDNHTQVAQDILSTLQIDPSAYSSNNPMKEWIHAAEAKGIFVSRTSFINSRLTLDSTELQGFALSDPYAPFVFVNSEDWNAPQLFTLVHELAHLWIAQSGISNITDPANIAIESSNAIELFCNQVAANALMPESLVNNALNWEEPSATELFKVSKQLGISSFAMLVRAFKLNLLSLDTYRQLKTIADREYNDFVQREQQKAAIHKKSEKKGGPNYYLLQLNRNGKLFTQSVLDAFRGGYIEPTIASHLLNVQTTKFHKLEAQLYR